jgi:release factor glutamine methyltransferase
MSPEIASADTLEAMIRAGANALGGSQSPRLDARVLAKHVLGVDDAALIARAGDPVLIEHKQAYDALIMRRACGEPIAYITGVKEFWGLEFRVTRDVLIPRSDSECIIETVLQKRSGEDVRRILDLGTGSGCLLCALLKEFPEARGVGVDVSEAAIRVARENGHRLGLAKRAEFVASDWFDKVDGVFDVIVANAPYIPEADRSALIVDVSEFEPDRALFAGRDGLDAYRAIFSDVCGYLTPGGIFALEFGTREQGEALRTMIAETLPPGKIVVIRDLAARERGVALTLE